MSGLSTSAGMRSDAERARRLAARRVRRFAGALLMVSVALGLIAPQAAEDAQAPGGSIVPAARQAENVAIITIDREIDAMMVRSFERRLTKALDSGANGIVVELDTPGGEVGAVLEICELIKQSPVQNIVAWVHPQAYSGGAIIAIACREICISDGATLGDALPIAVAMGMLMELNAEEREKILSPILAELVGSARLRGHDELLVQGFARLGVELWWVEHSETGERYFVNAQEYQDATGVAVPGPGQRGSPRLASSTGGSATPSAEGAQPAPEPSSEQGFRSAAGGLSPSTLKEIDVTLEGGAKTQRPDFRDAEHRGKYREVSRGYISDGTAVFTFKGDQLLEFGLATPRSATDATVSNDTELASFMGATNMRRLNETWSERMVKAMSGFLVRGVLIVVFLVALFIEMTSPGLILPGSIAALALVLLIAPAFLNNMASWWEIAAILVGIASILIEIFIIPGFGVFGVGGMLLLFGGLVGTFVTNDGLFPDTAEERSGLVTGVVTILLATITSVAAMWGISKHFGTLPVLGRMVLTGESGQIEGEGPGVLAAMADDPVGHVAVGDEGVAVTVLRPSGRAQFGEEIVDVVSELPFVEAGTPVRVTEAGSMRVAVEPIDKPGGARA